jgi:CubicO group peptidase (beta-lactamase class C family)
MQANRILTRNGRVLRRLVAALGVVVCLSIATAAVGTSAGAAGSRASFQDLALPARPLHTDDTDVQLLARLEQRIPALMKDGDVPGLSVAVIRHGEVIWHRGFGVTNVQTGALVTGDTVFEAASLGKPVFAYAVLKLVDQGVIDLDRPLDQYLPGLYGPAGDPRLGLITPRHVLTHTTGLQNWPAGELKTYFTPGARFSYSGQGFVLLSRVVERVTGRPTNEFLKRTIFEPLGMTNSSYLWEPGYDALGTWYHNSRGAVVAGQGKPSSPDVNVAAGLRTTGRDYARFLAALLRGDGLKPETRRLLATPHVAVREGGSTTIDRPQAAVFPGVSWGLGVGLQPTADGLSFWHWGNNTYAKAYFVVFQPQQTGVVIFANSVYGLSIVPAIVAEAVGGAQPAMIWLRVEPYTSPGRVLFRALMADGAAPALGRYFAWREGRPTSEWLTEDQLNRFGLDLLRSGRVMDAIEVLKLNVKEHPQSFNVYDSLGEAYAVDGNKALAIANYTRSIEINPKNTDGIEALKKLRGVPPLKP